MTSKRTDTLSDWKRAVALREKYEAKLKEWAAFERDFAKKHREKHPLSPAKVKSIVDIYEKGHPLCCSGGHDNLKSIRGLDECWFEYIYSQAYDLLGCGDSDWCPGGRRYEDGKKTLMKILTGQA